MSKNKTYIISRRFKLIPLNKDEVEKEAYSFIKNSTYAQYQALNLGMGHTVSTFYKYNRDFKNEDYKLEIREFRYNLTNPLFNEIEFGRGIDTLSAVSRKVKKDFSTALKNGLANGDRSATNYKRNFPLMTRGRDLRFSINEKDEVFIKWVNGINFKVILGRKSNKNYNELQSIVSKIMDKTYKLGESKLFFDKNNHLYIDVSLDITDEINERILEDKKERVMGIDLGISIPAYAVVSDNTYLKKQFGNKFEVFKTKTQFRERRKRVQRQIDLAKGGKGRKDKLSALNALEDKERNWTKTYNHQMSKKIVDFAKNNDVTQINLEKLTKDGFSDKLLGKWSYYELQQMITYKAEKEGIIVKYVNPAFTSQMCSKCGHTCKENRKTQENFICVECGFSHNADFNAALNISRSANFVEKDEDIDMEIQILDVEQVS